MSTNLEYTVLMSVYKKERPQWLKISIESMLNQTVRAKEFIIIKDGPLTDELDEVIDQFVRQEPDLFRIIALEKNVGLGPALAIGIEESKTELIARMDSDDYSVPERIEKQLEKFSKDPDLEMVGTFEVEFMVEQDNVIAVHKVPESDEEIKQFMRKRCALLHPTVMYKRSAVLRSGNYRSVLLYEDYDLFLRMVLENNVKSYNIQENLYYIRISDEFFKRRGGLKYLKTVMSFKWKQFRKGNMKFPDFCISGFGQAFVCLLPNSLRKKFYLKFLR